MQRTVCDRPQHIKYYVNHVLQASILLVCTERSVTPHTLAAYTLLKTGP